MKSVRAQMSVTVNQHGFPLEIKYGSRDRDASTTDFARKNGVLSWRGVHPRRRRPAAPRVHLPQLAQRPHPPVASIGVLRVRAGVRASDPGPSPRFRRRPIGITHRVATLVALAAAGGCGAPGPELTFADWILPLAEDIPVREYAPIAIEDRDPDAVRWANWWIGELSLLWYRPVDIVGCGACRARDEQ